MTIPNAIGPATEAVCARVDPLRGRTPSVRGKVTMRIAASTVTKSEPVRHRQLVAAPPVAGRNGKGIAKSSDACLGCGPREQPDRAVVAFGGPSWMGSGDGSV
jgi:hypothetical protein